MSALSYSFDSWWRELTELASIKKFELYEKHTYMDYYDDGDSPAEALKCEMGFLAGDLGADGLSLDEEW